MNRIILWKLAGSNGMSLKINNRATPKQIEILKQLDYCGKWDISTDEAAEIISELWEERRLEVKNEQDEYNWDN